MLTADLVNARRRGDELRLVALDAAGARARPRPRRARSWRSTAAHVGRDARGARSRALAAVDVGAARAPPARRPREAHRGSLRVRRRRRRRPRGRCGARCSRARARRAAALAAGRALRPRRGPGRGRARARYVGRTPSSARSSPTSAARTCSSRSTRRRPPALVDAYERAQAQAVLLRAVQGHASTCAARRRTALRALFRRLKFLRLLHTVARTRRGAPHRHRRPVQPVRVGHQVRPSARARAAGARGVRRWRLEADVRWGKERTPLVFRLAGECHAARRAGGGRAPARRGRGARRAASRRSRRRGASRRTHGILELPGRRALRSPISSSSGSARGGPRERVYLEVMGYWSRAAVWKRVELVQAGLAERILFAVSAQLRVSEEVLDERPSRRALRLQADDERAHRRRATRKARHSVNGSRERRAAALHQSRRTAAPRPRRTRPTASAA